MARPRKTKPKVIKKVEPKVKIFLKCLGRTFNSEADTFEEAVDKIKISGGAKANSVILIEKGDYKKERILNGAQTNGIFGQGSPSLKAIHLKGVKSILGI